MSPFPISHSHSSPSLVMSFLVCCYYFLPVCTNQGISLVAYKGMGEALFTAAWVQCQRLHHSRKCGLMIWRARFTKENPRDKQRPGRNPAGHQVSSTRDKRQKSYARRSPGTTCHHLPFFMCPFDIVKYHLNYCKDGKFSLTFSSSYNDSLFIHLIIFDRSESSLQWWLFQRLRPST